uniref:Uncharacterized protein n=1 Tax=Aegilops tauschii subsp. strangulata TaxID=200361 RepID=A0A452YYA8_AEGTS
MTVVKKNGFDIINNCIVRLSYALRLEKGSHGMTHELLEERKTLFDYTWLLVDVISHVGEDLSQLIIIICYNYSVWVYWAWGQNARTKFLALRIRLKRMDVLPPVINGSG